MVHTITFFRINLHTLSIIDKIHSITDRAPPANYKLDGYLPACQAYCFYINVLAISDDDIAATLATWEQEGGIVAVCHDDLLVMPDFFATQSNLDVTSISKLVAAT